MSRAIRTPAASRRRRPVRADDALVDLVSPEAFDALSRVDLMTFVERVFAELDRAHPFQPNWHLELMCSHLAAVAAGEVRREVINVPPRSLKSICTSIALVAWMLGHTPAKKIMVVSYGQDLADKLARDTRQVMQSDWYRRLFPATVISQVRSAASDFETTQGGGRFATSFGGAITGRGCDLIIIDDPIKPEEALSERARSAVADYVASTLRTRFNDQSKGAILLVMQRLHEDDLCGHLLRQSGWAHLNLPAIAEAEEVWTFATPFGLKTVVRKEGEALHPGHMGEAVLASLRADLGAYLFAAQYQQRPAPLGGGLVRLEMFGRYERSELPASFDYVLQSWDTANKAGELNDYSVCTTWGVKGRFAYLLTVDRQKMEYPQLKSRIALLWSQERPHHLLIEDGASGSSLLQELRQANVSGVIACKAQTSKEMRLMVVSSMIEAGDVLLPKDAPWLIAYESEVATFPNGRHDDQVDSTTQALRWIMERGRTDGLFRFIREEALRNRPVEEDDTPVRLRVPLGVQFIAMDGMRYTAGADGLVVVARKNAPRPLPIGWELQP